MKSTCIIPTHMEPDMAITHDQVIEFCLEMGAGAFEWSEVELRECAAAYLRRQRIPANLNDYEKLVRCVFENMEVM